MALRYFSLPSFSFLSLDNASPYDVYIMLFPKLKKKEITVLAERGAIGILNIRSEVKF